MPDESTTSEGQTTPAAGVLRSLERGRVHADLSEGIKEVARAVMETHRSGTVTLTLKISKSRQDGAIEVDPILVVKPPRFDRGSTVFFVDDDGSLSRNDPHQEALFNPTGPTGAVPDYQEASNDL